MISSRRARYPTECSRDLFRFAPLERHEALAAFIVTLRAECNARDLIGEDKLRPRRQGEPDQSVPARSFCGRRRQYADQSTLMCISVRSSARGIKLRRAQPIRQHRPGSAACRVATAAKRGRLARSHTPLYRLTNAPSSEGPLELSQRFPSLRLPAPSETGSEAPAKPASQILGPLPRQRNAR